MKLFVIALLCVCACLLVWLPSTPSSGDGSWRDELPFTANQELWASEPLAHLTLSHTARAIRTPWMPLYVAGGWALSAISRFYGLIYLSAFGILWWKRRAQHSKLWWILPLTSPITILYLGYLELSHWGITWSIVALTALLWNSSGRLVGPTTGVAVATHGIAWFAMPSIWWSSRQARDLPRRGLETFAVLGLIYFLIFMLSGSGFALVSGNIHGGGNGSLLCPPWSHVYTEPMVWVRAGVILLLCAPTLGPYLAMGRLWPQPSYERWLCSSTALSGGLFVLTFNSHVLGWLYDTDLLVSAMAPFQFCAAYASRALPTKWLSLLILANATSSVGIWLLLWSQQAPLDMVVAATWTSGP